MASATHVLMANSACGSDRPPDLITVTSVIAGALAVRFGGGVGCFVLAAAVAVFAYNIDGGAVCSVCIGPGALSFWLPFAFLPYPLCMMGMKLSISV